MQITILPQIPNWLVQQGLYHELENHFAQPGPHNHKCFLFCWGTALDTIARSQFHPATDAILN